jgi:hypothetical protein
MTDREHPAVKAVEPSEPDASFNRRVAEPEVEQLAARHDTVLAGRERRDLRVWGEQSPHSDD